MTSSLLLPLILSLFFSSSATAAGDGDGLTAYQALQQYDFPIGILPQGVLGYELDRATGKFTAHFNATCSFSLEGSYQLRYRPTITGVISRDHIRNLNGISVKVLLFWVNIIEVVRSGNELDFSVGIASASFTVDNFAECPQCGCGLNCNNDDGAVNAGPSLLSSSR